MTLVPCEHCEHAVNREFGDYDVVKTPTGKNVIVHDYCCRDYLGEHVGYILYTVRQPAEVASVG